MLTLEGTRSYAVCRKPSYRSIANLSVPLRSEVARKVEALFEIFLIILRADGLPSFFNSDFLITAVTTTFVLTLQIYSLRVINCAHAPFATFVLVKRESAPYYQKERVHVVQLTHSQ
jgi:hypothetical protein